jgi:serine/threonine protein kinase/predicted RNA-binding protein YlqC (UPF0109 family)
MAEVVEVNADSEDDVAEVVDVIDDSGDESAPQVRLDGPPLRFHGYRRGRELGRGASGKVFVCNRKGDESGFAVKAVDLRRMQLSPNVEREHTQLWREVGILKTLPHHESIVQMVDAFEEGNWFLLILELVGGGDLYTTLTERQPARLMEREATFVLGQLADGLAFLHSQSIIHRDLKLENVLVASERREGPFVLYSVKITDFGLSKAIGHGISEARSLVGTHPYTAPEVTAGGPALQYDFSSDLWCLGVLLYVLLAGHFPFDSIAEQQCELDSIIERLHASEAARSVVCGLLQLAPEKRLTLDALCSHEWMRDATKEIPAPKDDRQPKRQRITPVAAPPASTDVPSPLLGPRRVGMATIMPPTPVAGEFAAGIGGIVGALASPSVKHAIPPAVVPLLGLQEVAKASPDGEELIAEEVATSAPTTQVPAPQQVHNTSCVGEWLAYICSMARKESLSASSRDSSTDYPSGVPSASTTVCDAPSVDLSDVYPANTRPDAMQVHIVVPERTAGIVLSKAGVQMKQLAATVGCKVRVMACSEANARVIIVVGNYNQCVIVQELVHGRLTDALRVDGQQPVDRSEVVLWVRAEAAGVVIGKQGFVLKQIRKQSGARIQLLRDQVKGQRPCILAGEMQSILRAERHVFDLVRAVPVAAAPAAWGGGPDLPRSRISSDPVLGEVVSWKGRIGWIQCQTPIDHPQAAAHRGHIYVHEKDVVTGGPLASSQKVTFHVYSDKSGLGAEACTPVDASQSTDSWPVRSQ